MFEENLQLKTAGFGLGVGQRPRPKNRVFSDILAPAKPKPSVIVPNKHKSFQASTVQLPVAALTPSLAVPDTAVLPDYLLLHQVPAFSPIDEGSSPPRKLVFCLCVVVLVGLGLIAAQQISRTNLIGRTSALIASINPTDSPQSPLTIAPSAMAISNYQVAADAPRYITIESLEIHSRVRGVEFGQADKPKTPINVYDTAWDKNSAKPGETAAMIISAPAGCIQPGVFSDLRKIALGADIIIARGDGAELGYKVIKSQVYNKDQVNHALLSDPPVHGRPGINIVTCAGQQAADGGYDKRLVVNAVLYY